MPRFEVPPYSYTLKCTPKDDTTWIMAASNCLKASGYTGNVYDCFFERGECIVSEIEIDYSKSGYRLPTEAEWEYACRGGTTTDYYWGSDSIDNYAWNIVNSNYSIHPVAVKLPNSYGLYDMIGNVWEWCNDWYALYSSDTQTDPVGSTTGLVHVQRGGSVSSWWDYYSYSRLGYTALHNELYYDGKFIGFRVVCLAP